jgi:alpha-tubulin suppressor-like RCC1 family protein
MKMTMHVPVTSAVAGLLLLLASTNAAAQAITVTPANPTVAVGQTQPFTANDANVATAVSVGPFHACALLQDGSIRCWGLNDSGQLGNGTRGNTSSTPVSVTGILGATAVAAGAYHTCALFPDGTIQCWGRNDSRQLGDPATTADSSTVPVRVSGITTATALVSVGFHSCALLADGTVRCWGQNDSGQLGDGTVVNSATPVTVSGISGVAAIAVGGWHSCALLGNGTVRCWGQNIYGQLGNGTFVNSPMPTAVSGLTTAAGIPPGIFHQCAILQDRSLQCWGRNDEGRLGNGTTTNGSTPSPVAGITVTGAAGGGEHSCAVLSDRTISCWGDNNYGQFGNGAPVGFRTTPQPPATGITAAATVGSGAEYSCALIQGGVVQCWGRNVYGQIGDGTNTDARTPVSVAGLGGVAWTSSDPSVATINGSGVATAVAAGSTTITATSGGQSGSTTLTVASPVTLTLIREGAGAGTVTSSPAGINCGATCSASYNPNTTVTLTATPDAGSTFQGWTGGGCTGTGACTVTMTANTTVRAAFGLASLTLTVTRDGAGTGTVTSSPAGIDCGATCSAAFNQNSTVTLTATPAGGSTFQGWTGGGCAGTGACTVTMTAATSVNARFGLPSFPLTVTRDGQGSGSVTSSPAGIDCGAACTANYTQNTVVTLTATPAGGSIFQGWSGGGCSGSGTCTVTMATATTVNARFGVPQLTLSVTRQGGGAGTVTSSPAGIDCGATCTAAFDRNTVVTLTATAPANSTFAGWSGGGCAGTGACTVTLTANTTVSATFIPRFTLAVTRAGAGTGTVTSNPAGINCGATCAASYNQNTVVTLTATAAAGSAFVGWSGGGCSGSGACTVTLGADTNVVANFVPRYTLTVNVQGSGTITSSPAGIDCGNTCSAVYNQGTAVTLTANPGTLYMFTGWSGGGCSGTGTCTVNMNANTTVTATFRLLGLL